MCAQLIKDVIVSLVRGLEHNARFLQEVRAHVRTNDVVIAVEIDLQVLAKATAVVITYRLRVTKRLGNAQIISGKILFLVRVIVRVTYSQVLSTN